MAASSSIRDLPSLAQIARGLLCALAASLCFGAWAQTSPERPAKGFLPLGGGASIPLPEGTWRTTFSKIKTSGQMEWDIRVLKNDDPWAEATYLVVWQSLLNSRWGNTRCVNTAVRTWDETRFFLTNEHGTKINELFNKCSRVQEVGNVRNWKNFETWPVGTSRDWFLDIAPGFVDMGKQGRLDQLLVDITLQQFNGRLLTVQAFVQPPKAVSSAQFRSEIFGNTKKIYHEMLDVWKSSYVEAIQRSYFARSPQPLMALGYEVATGDSRLAQAAPPVRQTAAPDSIDEQIRQMAPPAVPNAAAYAPTAPASVVPPPGRPAMESAASTAPARPAAPAQVPAQPARIDEQIRQMSPPPSPGSVGAMAVAPPIVTLAPAAVAQSSASNRELAAAEEERRKMAQQLQALTQALAKLQQENAAATAAAAAAAAAAKEREAKADTPAAAPANLPLMAHRKALVIGNDQYTDVPKLENAVADAEAMAASLSTLGYTVYKHINIPEKRFKQVLREFKQQVSGGDEVLVFFAGHGVQLGNVNFLLPVDIRGQDADQIRDEAIALQRMLDDLEEKKVKFALAVIDACRDNPFKGSGRAIGGRGLAPTTAATGQMIMFSAGSGQQALDRLGPSDKERNGLFTRIFLREMQKPGVSVDRVLRNVRNEVVRLARSVGHDQTPALYDQSIGEFFFRN